MRAPCNLVSVVTSSRASREKIGDRGTPRIGGVRATGAAARCMGRQTTPEKTHDDRRTRHPSRSSQPPLLPGRHDGTPASALVLRVGGLRESVWIPTRARRRPPRRGRAGRGRGRVSPGTAAGGRGRARRRRVRRVRLLVAGHLPDVRSARGPHPGPPAEDGRRRRAGRRRGSPHRHLAHQPPARRAAARRRTLVGQLLACR